MNDGNSDAGSPAVTEVVGRFADGASFTAATKALLEAGFERGDISVLDTHQSFSATEEAEDGWKETVTGLVGEANYLGPITDAGLIMLAAGPIGAVVAAAVGAGLAGAAMRDLLETVRATPHTREFAEALKNGALLLWVRAEGSERQKRAMEILNAHGAADVHVHERPTA